MSCLVFTLTHIRPLLLAIVFGGIEIMFLPNPLLIYYLLVAMLIDLFTGLLKSWSSGIPTTVGGFRKSAIKVGLYASIIISTWLLASLLSTLYEWKGYVHLVNMMIGILSFIELLSIFNNIYAMAPDSAVSRYVAKPILKLLRAILDGANKSISDDRKTPEGN